VDNICGLVVRAPGCRSKGPGSITGATRFSEKQWFSFVITIEELLGRKKSDSVLEILDYGRRDPSR
jgi:hypothetical protein